MFYKFLCRGRSPKVLERQVRGRIWWTVVIIVSVATVMQAGIFYGRGGTFGPGHVRAPKLSVSVGLADFLLVLSL